MASLRPDPRAFTIYLNLDRLLCQYSPSVLGCSIFAHMLVCWCDSMLINDMLGRTTLPKLSFSKWKRKVIRGRSTSCFSFHGINPRTKHLINRHLGAAAEVKRSETSAEAPKAPDCRVVLARESHWHYWAENHPF